MRSHFTPEFLLTGALCAGIAFSMSILCRNSSAKGAVPVAFLLALAPVAYLVGRLASLVFAVVAIVIFAVFLFQPYGSILIHSRVDGVELICFGLAAIIMVHFSPTREALEGMPARSQANQQPLATSGNNGTQEASNPLETWIAVVGYAIAFLAIVTILLYIW